MLQGAGFQREWHDNGKLQMEIWSICGKFSGRSRIWLRDGTLLLERFYLVGHVVSFEKYREVAAKFKALPKFRGNHRVKPLNIHRVFVVSLLEKRNQCEARKWLAKKTGDRTARSLGRFKSKSLAVEFVEALHQAGASEVIVPDIYRNKARDRFSDCLLVQLPKSAAQRSRVPFRIMVSLDDRLD